jgi:hypothetical protein
VIVVWHVALLRFETNACFTWALKLKPQARPSFRGDVARALGNVAE